MHRRKYIAPVIIVLLLCAYYIALAVVIVGRIPQLPLWAKLAAIVLPLLICGALLGVLVQRIREIRSGEEDDLDQY